MGHEFQVTDRVPFQIVSNEQRIASLPLTSTLEQELDRMVAVMKDSDPDRPDLVLSMTTALMARCTELYLMMVRVEAEHLKAKAFRTMQLQKVMDLVEFCSRNSSRLIEVRRQEIELQR